MLLRRTLPFGLSLLPLVLVQCGSRTGVPAWDDERPAPVQSCQEDPDCVQTDPCVELGCVDGFCEEISEVACATDDPCLVGACNSESGECEFSPISEDFDGDGFRAPLPGRAPGSPGACGDDCDDTRSDANPGGVEICDGIDNDCDGTIDNGIDYLMGEAPEEGLVRVGASAFAGSAGTALVHTGEAFVAGYWGRIAGGLKSSYLRGLAGSGAEAFAESAVSQVNAESFGPALAFGAGILGAAISDTRVDGNYEVYFARFGATGKKLGPDLRVTSAEGMSVNEKLTFDGERFVLVFEEHRDRAVGGVAQVMGSLLEPEEEAFGELKPLSSPDQYADQPQVAAGPRNIAVVYQVKLTDRVATYVRMFDRNLDPVVPPIEVAGAGALNPTVTSVGNRFLVAWETTDGYPGPSILGTLYSQEGNPIRGPLALTEPATFARSNAVLPLGDRFLLFWADYRTGNFELYAKVLSSELEELEPTTQLTEDPAITLVRAVAAGDDGRVGVLFDDWRDGGQQAYLRTLGCRTPELRPR